MKKQRGSAPIVFANNVQKLRRDRALTQAQLAALLNPPLAVSTLSRIESGTRRLPERYLEQLAVILRCKPEDIPVVPGKSESDDVNRWREEIRRSIDAQSAAFATVLVSLRRERRLTRREVCEGTGLSPNRLYELETGRFLQNDEAVRLARFYGLSVDDLFRNIEDKYGEFQRQVNRGVAPESLFPLRPRQPRPMVDVEARILHRAALRDQQARALAVPHAGRVMPVYGTVKNGRYILDRSAVESWAPTPHYMTDPERCFGARLLSPRLPDLIRPGTVALIDEAMPVSLGDLVLFERPDGTVDLAQVVGSTSEDWALRMFSPDERLPVSKRFVQAIYRVKALVFL